MSTTAGVTTSPLADFLLARIAGDQAAAMRAVVWPSVDGLAWVGPVPAEATILSISGHRLLAECVAKRLIVEEHRPIPCENARHPNGLHCAACSYDDIPKEWHPCPTLRLLALPYADHPDYHEEWKP